MLFRATFSVSLGCTFLLIILKNQISPFLLLDEIVVALFCPQYQLRVYYGVTPVTAVL